MRNKTHSNPILGQIELHRFNLVVAICILLVGCATQQPPIDNPPLQGDSIKPIAEFKPPQCGGRLYVTGGESQSVNLIFPTLKFPVRLGNLFVDGASVVSVSNEKEMAAVDLPSGVHSLSWDYSERRLCDARCLESMEIRSIELHDGELVYLKLDQITQQGLGSGQIPGVGFFPGSSDTSKKTVNISNNEAFRALRLVTYVPAACNAVVTQSPIAPSSESDPRKQAKQSAKGNSARVKPPQKSQDATNEESYPNKLRELKALRDDNIITEEEYKEKKKDLLNAY